MKWWTPEAGAVQEMGWYEPLVAVSRRARGAHVMWPVFIDDFEFFGRVERGARPTLSVYGHLVTGQSLVCDASGTTYTYVEHRSGRSSGRFKEVSLRGALWQCGLPEVTDATLTPRPARRDTAEMAEIDEIDVRSHPAALRVV